MNEIGTNVPNRTTIINILAIAGFIALIGGSMWLAVYSTRYVPNVVGRMGAAAVYLGSVFTPAPEPTLSVIPTASTTIPFGEEASSTASATAPSTEVTVPAKTIAPTAGKQTSRTIQIGGATTTVASPVLFGSPDLAVSILAIGYGPATSVDATRIQDFVESSTTPVGMAPAIKFSVKNIGTNVMPGGWHFSVISPAAFPKDSGPLPELYPNQERGWITAIDPVGLSTNTPALTVTVDPTNLFVESNKNNNSTTTVFTIVAR